MTSAAGDPTEGLRINAVAELSGLSAHTIRAWERRYGVPRPPRSTGRQRLYSAADVADLRRMAELSRKGASLASAARTVLREREDARLPAPVAPSAAGSALDAFYEALISFDESRANAVWAAQLAASTIEDAVISLAIPALQKLGDDWAGDLVSVAQEHFASAFVRGRLEALARQLGTSSGAPLVVLACLPGDQHELSLLMMNLLLRRRGLHTVYLGQSVPVDDVVQAAIDLAPPVLVVHGSDARSEASLRDLAGRLSAASPRTRIVFGGQGFETGHPLTLPGATFGGHSLDAALDLIEGFARHQS